MLLVPASALAQIPTQVVEYYHTDVLGSVRAVTKQVNGQWQVVARHDFMPFGEEVSPQYPPPDKRLFTGKERDHETGLDYFEARYLGGGQGRFSTIDPLITIEKNLVDPQQWNRYAYVRNNPLRWVDPTGATIDFADERSERLFNDYLDELAGDPKKYAQLLATIELLRNSRVNYRVNATIMTGKGEGFLSADKQGNVLVNVLNVGGPRGETMDMKGRLAHELEHARQFDQGELGLAGNGRDWGPLAASYDLFDEVRAFSAQLAVSAPVLDSSFLSSLRALDGERMAEAIAAAYANLANRREPRSFVIPGAPPGVFRTAYVYGVIR